MWGAKAGLWGLFALCLISSGALLLPACGLGLPLQLSSRLQSQFCPVPIDRSAVERANEARQVTQERIRKAELEIARIAPCASAAPASRPGRS
jgi:hypothetical protein